MKTETSNTTKPYFGEHYQNQIIAKGVSFVFDFVKHFIRDIETSRKMKKIDKMEESFATIEHMLVKQEKLLNENRRLIEELRNRITIAEIIIIALLITVLIQLIR